MAIFARLPNEEPPLASLFWTPDSPVSEDPSLQAKIGVLFRDDRWDLSALQSAPTGERITFNFGGLYAWQTLLAKELIAHLLNNRQMGQSHITRRHLSLSTLVAVLGDLRWLFKTMEDLNLRSLSEIQQQHVKRMIRMQPASGCSPESYALKLSILSRLYYHRSSLTCGGLDYNPFAYQSPQRALGVIKRGENRTPLIPEDIASVLLRWALAYIDIFAPDILAAEADYSGQNSKGQLHTAFNSANEQDRLVAYLEDRVDRLRGIPAVKTHGHIEIANAYIEREAGLPAGYLSENSPSIIDVMVKDHGYCTRFLQPPVAALPGSAAVWHLPFTVKEMKAECEYLSLACYIVCAYLSGMRDSEVRALQRDCLEMLRDAMGDVFRYKLKGKVHKGRSVPLSRKWIVIEPVARAVTVLQALTEHFHQQTGTNLLFSKIHAREAKASVHWVDISAMLRKFMKHCQEDLAPRLASPEFPSMPQEELWHLTSRQFRRSLAWHIANRPFGVVAGMIQYGHVAVKTFEGYADHGDVEFREQVSREQLLKSLGDVIDMCTDSWAGIHPAGPIGVELRAFFARVKDQYGDFPGEVVDRKRMEQLLKNKAANVHLGPLVHCFFRESEARCLPKRPDDEVATAPIKGVCDPHCQNACWTHRNLPQIEKFVAEADGYSKLNRISPQQRDHLLKDRDSAKAMIAAIQAAQLPRASEADSAA